ncbi:hypothetical protein GGI25_003555 [Coemansia spiralis]|uniref:SGF29 C-terminal domain-containing protein n=1 Tax=Coemansia spiralis TaxID=417178 RepID=A0A9W8KY21_9FUNG|nr:hypothetical protein GGI25_003555 [Coemansia spiralis]
MSFSSASPDATQKHDLEVLLHQLRDLEHARKDQLPLLEQINTMDTPKKHLSCIDKALGLVQQEQRAAARALDQVKQLLDQQKMRKQRDNSSRTRSRDASSRLEIIPKGSQVAARVAPLGEEEWILATVLSYSAEKNRYTVLDDDQESPVRPTYVLSPRLVLFVTGPAGNSNSSSSSGNSRKWDRGRSPEMAKGQRVLALYPRTTVFYQGTVVAPPSSSSALSNGENPSPVYRLLFDDDDNQEVDVPAHLVLPIPRNV